ncbi:hypothetical protein ACPPVT_18335 [Angustibacter sp. McL0619]|uniref:hypothetical protein n=1 Tax=Angustibacter sp. McL0619 TaxID=3415676 RepID=UPI003CF54837
MVDCPAVPAPDESPCWAGVWHRVRPLDELWAQASLLRTVATLPRLHPWRLGDAKGAARQLQWVGRLSGSPDDVAPLGLLSVTSAEPSLDRGDGAAVNQDAVTMLAGWALGSLATIGRQPDRPRWAGALVRMPGTALPPMAWLPRSLRGADDPGTAWPTESVDVARRYTLHGSDLRATAALLTPAVMALALDAVPADSAVTISGDALHVWWPYTGNALHQVGRVARAGRAARLLVDAFPNFVLSDFPDLSEQVESTLAERHADAAAYRANRRPGASADPVMQRIYQQAQADYRAAHPD